MPLPGPARRRHRSARPLSIFVQLADKWERDDFEVDGALMLRADEGEMLGFGIGPKIAQRIQKRVAELGPTTQVGAELWVCCFAQSLQAWPPFKSSILHASTCAASGRLLPCHAWVLFCSTWVLC